MMPRIIPRFPWRILLLIAACLAALDLYVTVAGYDPALLGPFLVASVLIFLVASVATFLFARAFARRAAQLGDYAERLLDPQVAGLNLPAGDDELGDLARSLRRMAPRIQELVDTLKLESERRQAILASMVEGVLAVDKNLRVTFCNDSFARTVAARVPVSAGTPLHELVRDPDLLEIMTTVLAAPERVQRRITLAAASGHSFDVLAGPLAGPSTTPGALAILHDVTELERLERVRKDFVANVSHELRTPLAAIHGYAETLLAGALDDQENRRKFVEVILAQAGRLTNIASDLLTLSELERGKSTPQPVSVRAALETALRTVEANALARRVRLIRGAVDDVRVMAHELRLEQVFVNLLDNAVKFNRPGGEVRVDVLASNGKASITIADTGIGIPSEDLPRIFERFYRVDKARSREMGGTGLGLSIVRRAIEQMGGAIAVNSRLGEGTRFTITVPAVAL